MSAAPGFQPVDVLPVPDHLRPVRAGDDEAAMLFTRTDSGFRLQFVPIACVAHAPIAGNA